MGVQFSPGIPALRRGNCEFGASLGYIAKPCPRKKQTKMKQITPAGSETLLSNVCLPDKVPEGRRRVYLLIKLVQGTNIASESVPFPKDHHFALISPYKQLPAYRDRRVCLHNELEPHSLLKTCLCLISSSLWTCVLSSCLSPWFLRVNPFI